MLIGKREKIAKNTHLKKYKSGLLLKKTSQVVAARPNIKSKQKITLNFIHKKNLLKSITKRDINSEFQSKNQAVYIN